MDRTTTRTLVVCGDSTASALGLPTNAIRGAYPSRLRASLGGRGFRVVSLARPGRTLSTELRSLDRVIGLDPDVVVISHGGLENVVRLPRALRYLPVPPIVAGERRRPLHRIRRTVYVPLFVALSTPALARALRRVGIGPREPVSTIHREYAALVERLLRRTAAHLVLVVPPTGTMSFQPLSEEGLTALAAFLRASAASSPRISVVDLRSELAGRPVFQADGTHLTVEGHAAAFELLRRALRPEMLQPTSRPERAQVAVG